MWVLSLLAFALCLLVSTCVAVGEDGSTLPTELKDLLGASRHAVKLGAALVAALVTYFLTVVKIEDIEEVSKDAPDEMEEAASEKVQKYEKNGTWRQVCGDF